VERTLREAELPSFELGVFSPELGRSSLNQEACCLNVERALREAELPSFELGVFSSELERSSFGLRAFSSKLK